MQSHLCAVIDPLSGKENEAVLHPAIMHLSKEGDYRIESSAIIGNYRLWPSRMGNAMTLIYKDPSHGAFTAIFLYEIQEDALTLTPIEGVQVMTEKAVIWKRR
jgi:hypothetical protein